LEGLKSAEPDQFLLTHKLDVFKKLRVGYTQVLDRLFKLLNRTNYFFEGLKLACVQISHQVCKDVIAYVINLDLLYLRFLKASRKHGSELFTKLRDNDPVCKVFFALDEKSDVRKFRFVPLVSQLSHETVRRTGFYFKVEFRAGVGV